MDESQLQFIIERLLDEKQVLQSQLLHTRVQLAELQLKHDKLETAYEADRMNERIVSLFDTSLIPSKAMARAKQEVEAAVYECEVAARKQNQEKITQERQAYQRKFALQAQHFQHQQDESQQKHQGDQLGHLMSLKKALECHDPDDHKHDDKCKVCCLLKELHQFQQPKSSWKVQQLLEKYMLLRSNCARNFNE